MLNDKSGKNIYNWSSARNNEQRLRHRPHIVTSANNRNNLSTRYFSAVDADLYFGDQFIDEVVSIQWQVQQNVLPIFGYNSYTFDDLAVGNRIVNGQFAVNYIESNYLTKVMKAMKKINRKMYGEDKPVISAFSDSDRQRRNTPIWDAGFDLLVGYGEKNKDAYEQVIILDCCQLTGCAQQLDSNGEPILEIYSFIARDMKFSEISSSNSDKPTSSTKDEFIITDSIIDVDSNNKDLKIIYSCSEDVEVVGANVKLNIQSNNFNTVLDLTVRKSAMSYEFDNKKKQDIIDFCSQFNTDKVEGTLTYAYATYGETKNVEKKIVFKVSK